jgi:hypothetical protein
MPTSHKLTHVLLLIICLLGLRLTAAAQNSFPAPGVSDQQAGWMLVYPYYTSSSANTREDSFITITNASSTRTATVHLFFIEGKSCVQADMFLCLTPNASQGFKASEIDPDNTGYLIAFVVTETGMKAGCPDTAATILIGNAFVNLPNSGIQGNYGAEAFGSAGASCTLNGNTARLTFNAPNRFAVEVQSPLTIPNQRIVMVGLSGDFNGTLTGAGQTGAGLIINGDETPSSSFTSWIPEGCQSSVLFSLNSPRASGGVGRIIPAGQVGIIKFNATAAVGLLMVPTNATGRTGIRTLHKLGTAVTTIDLAVFNASC